MAKILFTGDTMATSYECSPVSIGLEWLNTLKIIGLDTETNVVESYLNRQLKVISIADEGGTMVWVIEWEFLTDVQKYDLMQAIKTKLCIIQNVSFDYKMFTKHGVILEKVYDTMLAEQILTNGYSSENGYHGLQAIYQRRFGLDISKDEQLTFGQGPYSDKQIQYAAIDTLKLGLLRKLQLSEARAADKLIKHKGNKGLVKTIWWENEFVKAVADMEMTGIRIDKDKWYAIEDAIRPIFDEELNNLNEIARRDFWDILEINEWISNKDEFLENVWSSSSKKKLVLAQIFPFEIEKTAKAELKKILQDNDPNFPINLKLTGKSWEESDYPTQFVDKYAIIKLMLLSGVGNKDEITKHLSGFLLMNMRDFCIEQGWLRPANKIGINWASPTQRLKIFQAVNPNINSTSKEVLVDYIEDHVILQHYLAWAEVEYQLKSFGKPFYDKHVELDGKHRTRFNQILATGRLSSVNPNLLNIPRKNDVYRAALIPDPGFELIDADYDGQELIITAELSQEQSWLEYTRLGYDLHSKNAELIFGKDWEDATESGCTYYAVDNMRATKTPMYKKCKCVGHVEMRDKSKAVSFGK